MLSFQLTHNVNQLVFYFEIAPRDEATNNSDVFVTASNDEFINQLVNRVLSSSGSAERGEDQPATKRPRLRSNSSQQQRQEDCESPVSVTLSVVVSRCC